MQQTVRLLAIDLLNASSAVRDAFAMSRDELAALSMRARAAGQDIEVVVLADEARFEIYTTESSRQAVFRAVLGIVSARMPRSELATVRTTEAIGVAAAWHLMHRLLGENGPTGVRMLGALNAAVVRARSSGTLGGELAALFACAENAGWRIQSETSLGDGSSSPAEQEMDWFEAERIIEEELVTWQAARARQGSLQSVPASRLDPSYYAAAEPGSSVRLKARGLGTLVPGLARPAQRGVA